MAIDNLLTVLHTMVASNLAKLLQTKQQWSLLEYLKQSVHRLFNPVIPQQSATLLLNNRVIIEG